MLADNRFISCDLLCLELMQNTEVLFSGFVNGRGRMVAHGSSLLNFHNEKNLEMFVMEIALDFSMKNEFDDVLGKVEYAVTKRKNTNIVCIPMDRLILVIVADNQMSVDGVVKTVYQTLSKFTKNDVELQELVMGFPR